MSNTTPTYYARRWRTLFKPDALDFTTRRAARPAYVPVYSKAPSGFHCGLPRPARAPGAAPAKLLFLLLPIAAVTGVMTYVERMEARNR